MINHVVDTESISIGTVRCDGGGEVLGRCEVLADLFTRRVPLKEISSLNEVLMR